MRLEGPSAGAPRPVVTQERELERIDIDGGKAAAFFRGKLYRAEHAHVELVEVVQEDLGKSLTDPEFEELHNCSGFVTDRGRFVDRKEAMVIARAAGQVKEGMGGSELHTQYLRTDQAHELDEATGLMRKTGETLH